MDHDVLHDLAPHLSGMVIFETCHVYVGVLEGGM